MIEEISKIIKEKDFSRLIGLKENLWFEAKGKEPYQFDSPGGRYELAKDVSAFANSEGGHIVIGLTHKRLENEMAEEIIGLELILKAEFDIDKYRGLIKHYIYPEIDNISITWQESTNEENKGVGHIFIPLQKGSKKHFLITKGIIVEREELKDNVVGLARRVGSSNMPISGKEIYNIMQKGKSDFAQRLSGIENMLAVIDKNMSIMFHEINILQKPTQAVKQISFDKLYDAIKKATE
jgi:predicted HTH transcriptional regulator